MTNEHVTGDKYSKCYVTLEDGEEYSGTVIWADSDIDLSIVKITLTGLTPLPFGNSSDIRVGQTVYAIGNPIGLEFQSTVTSGIISAVNRTIKLKEEDKLSYMEDLIQTDATINEGNSGGPLINQKGEVIGINAVKIEEGNHLGFAIPIDIIKSVVEKIKNTGSFIEPSIGIYAYDQEVIKYLEEDLKFDTGIYVVSIDKTGASYGKGLLQGDIITKIDDVSLNKMSDLRKYIYTKEVGDQVILTISRNKKIIEIPIILGKK